MCVINFTNHIGISGNCNIIWYLRCKYYQEGLYVLDVYQYFPSGQTGNPKWNL